MSELANEFGRQNQEVHLVLLAKSKDFYSVSPFTHVHRLEFINRGFFQKKFAELSTFYKLRKLLKRENPDAVLSFMNKYNLLTIFASRFLKLKIFISERDNPCLQDTFFLSLLKKITYRYATGIVAQTSLAKEILQKKTNNKNIKIIANPLKKLHLYPENKREKIVLNVGRLVPEKGQRYLLEAFFLLKSDDWKLVILGEGPLREKLQKQAEQLSITNNLYMPGAVKDVDEWLARASIFAFPSISEGFPNALLEAMAAGLPCVSFDCDAGPRDFINNGENGFLVDLYNTNEFAQKIKILTENPELRLSLGTKASEVEHIFELSEIAKKYLHFLNSFT